MVIPDEVYAQTVQTPLGGVRRLHRIKLAVLRALYEQGPVENASGRAMGILYERARAYGYNANPRALAALLADPANALAFKRRTKGKRTFRIELGLVPETWFDKMKSEPEPVASEPEPELEPASSNGTIDLVVEPSAEEAVELMEQVIMPATESEPVGELPAELQVASAVAMELLTRVVEIVSTGGTDEAAMRLRRERDDARHRLAEQTDLSERRRRQLREVGDELHAVKEERNGLRNRLRLTEENLRKATSNAANATVMDLARKELDKVIRQVPVGPNSRGTDDG